MNELQSIYFNAKKQLEKAGIENPAFDAASILEANTSIDKAKFCICDSIPESFNRDKFNSDINRRINHEPLQYILKLWNFYGLDFFVGSGVLIPRQDTEILCENSIDFLNSIHSPNFLELCSGSGCISTVISKTVENSSGVCVELSDDALFYLNKNIEYHSLSDKVKIIKADVLNSQTPVNLNCKFGQFDLIVSNPPYIKSDDINFLQSEVKDFEPLMALDGGNDGLVFYRFFKNYISLLKTGGAFFCEIGIDEKDSVSNLFTEFGLKNVFSINDYNGIPRIVGGYKL